jgi:NAD-dependent dihydropyrimidine dehydrogenase PreA subunit
MEKEGHDVSMRTYRETDPCDIPTFDAVCFAAPVYEWAPARNVEQWIEAMPGIRGKPCFIITSCAGQKGQATQLLAKMLQDKGLAVLGDHNLICPDSWGGTRRWSHAADSEKPTVDAVRELAGFTGRMLESIGAFISGDAAEVPGYRVSRTGLYYASRLSRLAPGARFKMGKKKVDAASCNECGLCARNCPVGAIEMGPLPRFGRECIACWSCINTCPRDSITCVLDPGMHYKGIAGKDELLKSSGLE